MDKQVQVVYCDSHEHDYYLVKDEFKPIDVSQSYCATGIIIVSYTLIFKSLERCREDKGDGIIYSLFN